MASRLELQTLLETLLGSRNVYFQPPPDFKMSYPCIVFSRIDIRSKFANNRPFIINKMYSITVIDANPDSLIPDKISNLAKCSFDRHFITDNLNHDVYNIIF